MVVEAGVNHKAQLFSSSKVYPLVLAALTVINRFNKNRDSTGKRQLGKHPILLCGKSDNCFVGNPIISHPILMGNGISIQEVRGEYFGFLKSPEEAFLLVASGCIQRGQNCCRNCSSQAWSMPLF